MSNIQYIGARYVIKVYENSQYAGSADWEQNVTYEPLTLVTYNFSSYLSKKDVPATIGNPAQNPDYWVVTGAYNGQIANIQEQLDLLNTMYVDIRNYGAKLDGVTDDSAAFQAAINDGNVLIPHNATIHIANSVYIPSMRIIDFNKAVITGNTNDPFVVQKISDSEACKHVIFKNAYVDASGGFTPFNVSNAYDITFDHVRVIQVKPGHAAVTCCNVFNVVFNACLMQGDSSVNPYPDNTTGIELVTDNGPMSALRVITNIGIHNCLLQRFKKGIHIHRNITSGNFEDINIINQGFSNCDICIDVDTTQCKCLNIHDVRAEYSETVIHNTADNVHIGQINGYDNSYIIDNSGECTLDSVWCDNPDANHPAYIIKSNTYVIRLTGTRYGGVNCSDLYDTNNPGTVYGQPYLPILHVAGQTAFTPRLVWRRVFEFTGSNNITNSTTTPFDGLTFDFIVVAGTVTIGDSAITADHKYHTATYIEGEWFVS